MLHPSEWERYTLLVSTGNGTIVSVYMSQEEFFEQYHRTYPGSILIYSVTIISESNVDFFADHSYMVFGG